MIEPSIYNSKIKITGDITKLLDEPEASTARNTESLILAFFMFLIGIILLMIANP